MAELVKDLEQEEVFSPYPEQVDKYFQDNTVTIQTFPDEISDVAEFEFPVVHVTSAKQYVDYLDGEIEFWKLKDANQKLKSITHYENLRSAKQDFEYALQNVSSSYSFQNYIKSSVSRAHSGALYSKTKLAQILLRHIDRSTHFFEGFRCGILNSKTNSMSSYADTHEGFLAALAYRETYKQYIAYSEDTIKEFQKNAEKASQNYADLNQSYVAAFHEQQQRIEQITKQTNEHLTELDQKSEKQYADADTRLLEMEALYREKLRLEEPAKYWDDMDKEYRTKGTWWLVASALLAAAIVGGLVAFLLFVPEIFSEDYHWFDNLKNSAILTVIASILIYMLRLTVKMATSSYHLSRDAKERNNLSYFYLALIEKGAVSDKERALILNALFSRSDTGLLKGDAAPSMPTNVSDIIEILKEKN